VSARDAPGASVVIVAAVEGAALPTLRPLGIGEILDVAIKIYLRNALPLFVVVLVVVAPVNVLSSLITVSAGNLDESVTYDAQGEPQIQDDFWLGVTGALAAVVLSVVATTLATGACFKAVADGYLGERPAWKTSLAFAARRLHSIIWVTVLTYLFAGIGFLLCILPGIYLLVSFAVAVPALLTEGTKGTKALRRAKRLVDGRWWATLAVVVLGYLLVGIVGGVFTGLQSVLALSNPDNEVVNFFATAIFGTASSMLTTPFTAAFITVMYFDLRVRKEGFDLQLLAERIGLTPRADSAYRPPPEVAGPPPGPPASGEQPPFWPPPPGWKPSSQDQAPE
jgi:hypothetical protein